MTRWMLYGAYGYTGQLLAEEAVRRGHKPLLAGRSRAKLEPLAAKLGLDFAAIDLQDEAALTGALADVDLVFHAAGPFVFTGTPMLHACLKTRTHYLDIAGEIPNLANTFSYADEALRRGVAVISGAGFDLIPTDCLAKIVADQTPGAVMLEIAIDALSTPSAGTFKSLLEMLPDDSWARENGVLQRVPWSIQRRTIHFSYGDHEAIAVPWGDLVTAYYTTGIPTIRTYMAVSGLTARLPGGAIPAVQALMRNASVRGALGRLATRIVKGPNAVTRQTRKSYVWARAMDASGHSTEAWLETLEAYRFTAVAGIQAIEKVLKTQPKGVLTPCQALGSDFVLGIEGTRLT